MNQKQDLHSASDPGERIIVLFRAIHKIYREHIFEKSRQYGLTGPQLGTIFVLCKNPFITLNQLSEQLGLTKSTVSGIIDRLVAQGIVIREIPEDNRRIVKLSLSPDFSKNNDLIDIKNRFVEDIIKDASPEDIEKIITGLERLHALMDNIREREDKK